MFLFLEPIKTKMKDFTFLVGMRGMVLKSMKLTFSQKTIPYPGDEGDGF